MGALSMSVEERDAFLSDIRVGVLAIERAAGPPLAVPVWYIYEPGGELWFLTEPDSIKGRLVTQANRFSLCAQSETPPYSYVSVEGSATISLADVDEHSRPLAYRYLGREAGEEYILSGLNRPRPIRVAMRPEKWWTVDYSKRGGP